MVSMSEPEPFTITIPEEQLTDLRVRLSAARVVPDDVAPGDRDPNGSWSYGTDRSVLKDFVQYWLEVYDWRAHEAKINELAHFTMPVLGLQMHFIHERSQVADAIPLLLVHGWPGSVVEFFKVIPKLKDAGFHVVAPSIPGFGWSEAPKMRGGNCDFMARHMHELMLQLGYDQYAAQGGDWGSIITGICARQYPEHCVAYHTNMCVAAAPPTDLYGLMKTLFGLASMSAAERQGLRSTKYFMLYETAYQKIQGTKPQSLAYGLNDSPVGLLAWILEKFQSWADCGGGGPEKSGLTKDEILTNVMVYWVTQTIASSCRIYYETLGHSPKAPSKGFGGYVAVPTGVLWANDIFKFPRFQAELQYNVKHWSVQTKGGHFFAFEQPQVFVAEVTHFFREVLSFEDCKRRTAKRGQGRPWELGRVLMYLAIMSGGAFAVQKHRKRWLLAKL